MPTDTEKPPTPISTSRLNHERATAKDIGSLEAKVEVLEERVEKLETENQALRLEQERRDILQEQRIKELIKTVESDRKTQSGGVALGVSGVVGIIQMIWNYVRSNP